MDETIKVQWTKRVLYFKTPAGTSRGVLTKKTSWYLLLKDDRTQELKAIGECGPIPGLSVDDIGHIENILTDICRNFHPDQWLNGPRLERFLSVAFGLESALFDLQHRQDGILFPSAFTEGRYDIPINGLIWMGNRDFMHEQIASKLEENYRCIKIKIGALDFLEECEILTAIRRDFGPNRLQIRVDANGAFTPDTALRKLQKLSAYDLHSIEQPIAAGQWKAMTELCRQTPIPIALDEELIGVTEPEARQQLLDEIQPQYIVLKPSLLGGFRQSQLWIEHAEKRNIGWWVTSALESAIGLNAIAQWTGSLNNIDKSMPQGLGTGEIYIDNFNSPLHLQNDTLCYGKHMGWNYRNMGI